MRVLKFGGSCLLDGSGLDRAVTLVRAAEPPVCVVVSALKGVTDALRDLALQAAGGTDPDVAPLLSLHRALIDPLQGSLRTQAEQAFDALAAELAASFAEVAHQGATPELLDRVLGWGERACAALATRRLQQAGVEVALRVGREAGVVTDAIHLHAHPVGEAQALVREALSGGSSVVPGFVGQTLDGRWTTLGRGGSDTTAALLGLALAAPVTLWKDTALLSADPQLVHDAQALQAVNHEDALALAAGGLPAIAADALELARAHGLELDVCAFEGQLCTQVRPDAPTPLAVVWVPVGDDRVRLTVLARAEPVGLGERVAAALSAAGIQAAAESQVRRWTVHAAHLGAAVRAVHAAL